VYRDLSAQLAAKEIEIATLQEQLEALKAGFDASEQELRARLDVLQKENERLGKRLDEARADRENDNRDAVLRNAMSQRDTLETENVRLRAELQIARRQPASGLLGWLSRLLK
jgi:chromosome segregation ATPase